MDFLVKNYVDTTTSIDYDSGTSTVAHIMTRDETFQYVTDNYNNDALTASLTINFDETLPVSRIALIGTNVKSFDIFYNGATANAFNISSGSTSTTNFISNSETSMMIKTDQVYCTSVTFDLKSTMLANSEKAIGMVYIGDLHFTFGRDPSSKNYKPKYSEKAIIHQMSNGSSRKHFVHENFNVQLKFKNISSSFKNNLRDLHKTRESFFFCPFSTMSSWDGIFHEVLWENSFDFFEYSDDFVEAGFSGSIKLSEVIR
jgi:hypothetical protein